MRGRRRVLGAGALMITVLFGGCLAADDDPVGRPFEELVAPEWSAGYSWTYAQTETYRSSYSGDGREDVETSSHETDFTLTVTNTQGQIGGDPVYFLAADQEVSSPIFGQSGGSILALTQKDLALAGTSYDGYYGYASPVEPVPYVADDVRYPGGHQEAFECDPTPAVTPVDPDEVFPVLRFPLDDGDTTTGLWSPDDYLTFGYTMTVRGEQTITVGAGTFEAIHVAVTFEARAPEASAPSYYGTAEPYATADNGGPPSLAVKADHWYSPEAQYLVRSVVTAAGQETYEYDSPYAFEFTQVLELDSFSLTPGTEQPAPYVEEAPATIQPYVDLQIVSDTEFPKNAADGPVTATFGVQERTSWEAYGNVLVVDEVPQEAPINPETHRLVWTVWSPFGGESQVHVGDTFTAEFDRAGHHGINAEVRPIRCHGSWGGSGYGGVTLYWQGQEHVAPPVGASQTIDVFEFPVEMGAASALVTLSDQPLGPGAFDGGTIRVVDPRGMAHPLEQTTPQGDQFVFYPYEPGTWTLQWQTGSVTLMDDVTLTLRVDYDGSFCCYH